MSSSGQWKCANCGTSDTPIKRKGPKGPGTLCNACGVRLMRGRTGPRIPKPPRQSSKSSKPSGRDTRGMVAPPKPKQSCTFQVIPAPDQPTLVAPSTNVKAIFAEPMERASTEAAFSLRRIGGQTNIKGEKPVKGAFKWMEDNKSFVFAPEKDLRGFTLYMLELTTAARYADGRNMPLVEKASFRTSEDDICYKCNVVNEEDLIMCDVHGCPRVYHRACLHIKESAEPTQIVCPATHACAGCHNVVDPETARLCEAEGCGRMRHIACPSCPEHPDQDKNEDDDEEEGDEEGSRKRKRADSEADLPPAKRHEGEDGSATPALGPHLQKLVAAHPELAAAAAHVGKDNKAFDEKLREALTKLRADNAAGKLAATADKANGEASGDQDAVTGAAHRAAALDQDMLDYHTAEQEWASISGAMQM